MRLRRKRTLYVRYFVQFGPKFTRSAYIRLLVLATLQIWASSLVLGLSLMHDIRHMPDPTINMKRQIPQYPIGTMTPFDRHYMKTIWWAPETASFLVFAFHGFSPNARKEYRELWAWFRSAVMRQKVKEPRVPVNHRWYRLTKQSLRSPYHLTMSAILSGFEFHVKAPSSGIRRTHYLHSPGEIVQPRKRHFGPLCNTFGSLPKRTLVYSPRAVTENPFCITRDFGVYCSVL